MDRETLRHKAESSYFLLKSLSTMQFMTASETAKLDNVLRNLREMMEDLAGGGEE